MSDILLAKPNLPEGFIDVSVGEPHVVRETLLKVFDLSIWNLPKEDHLFEYPSPYGYKPLVSLLEAKYNAPVIITNGAKQALGAAFYALHKLGHTGVEMKTPYWALIPPLAQMHGLQTVLSEPLSQSNLPYLLLSPNNPDGQCLTGPELKTLADTYKANDVPFIHDAAYYTRSYMPSSSSFPVVGDAQIYSISKMLGLSGLRVGYVVCHNPDLYKLILQYMEAMTVGVSIVSQMLTYHILNRMNGYPTLTESFENQSAMALHAAKLLAKQIDPAVLEVDSNLENNAGMFGWFKVGPKADFTKSKINLIDGGLFGTPGMVRMNLAFPTDKMEEIVRRLNSVMQP